MILITYFHKKMCFGSACRLTTSAANHCESFNLSGDLARILIIKDEAQISWKKIGWRFRRQGMLPESSAPPICPSKNQRNCLSRGQLRLHPFWDRLPDDPRLARILASLALKDSSPQARRT